jgi:hypothetical protein
LKARFFPGYENAGLRLPWGADFKAFINSNEELSAKGRKPDTQI